MQDIAVNLGEVVYHHRTRAGISQRELAERAQVSRHTVVNIEGGLASGVRFDTVCKVLAALGLEVRYMPRPVVPEKTDAHGAEARERFRRRFVAEGEVPRALFAQR